MRHWIVGFLLLLAVATSGCVGGGYQVGDVVALDNLHGSTAHVVLDKQGGQYLHALIIPDTLGRWTFVAVNTKRWSGEEEFVRLYSYKVTQVDVRDLQGF